MVPLYRARLSWLTAEAGGRKSPFAGSRYAPTARFVGEDEQFSVVMEFPAGAEANPTSGTIRLLFPDLIDVQQRMRPGVNLEIMEGPRVVARCVVESRVADAMAAVAE